MPQVHIELSNAQATSLINGEKLSLTSIQFGSVLVSEYVSSVDYNNIEVDIVMVQQPRLHARDALNEPKEYMPLGVSAMTSKTDDCIILTAIESAMLQNLRRGLVHANASTDSFNEIEDMCL